MQAIAGFDVCPYHLLERSLDLHSMPLRRWQPACAVGQRLSGAAADDHRSSVFTA